MWRIQALGRSACILVAAASLTGCNSGPKLVPVTGTVTLDGKPLDGANIAFSPHPGNEYPAQGTDVTGAEGNYKLSTNGRAGLPPGKYTVSISKLAVKPGVELPENFKMDPIMAKMAGLTKETLPASVSGVGKSQFERDVGPDGTVLDFDVKADKATGKKEK